MKSANRKTEILIIVLFTIAGLFLMNSLINELYLVVKLFYVNSVGDLVSLVTHYPNLQQIYLVRLFTSYSDMNIQLSNILSMLRIQDVIPFVFYMFIYDYNRSHDNDSVLRIGLKQFFITLVFKYLSLIFIMLVGLGISANVVILLKIVSIVLILSSLLFVISFIIMFIGMFRIVREDVE